MSADNGIYVLKTGKQYRVSHLQAIDNLYWNEEKKCSEPTMQAKQILKMFPDKPFTYDETEAMKIATNMYKRLPICEYGIVPLDAERSWGTIKNEAYGGPDKKVRKCRQCRGYGYFVVHGEQDHRETCPDCEGTGYVAVERVVKSPTDRNEDGEKEA